MRTWSKVLHGLLILFGCFAIISGDFFLGIVVILCAILLMAVSS